MVDDNVNKLACKMGAYRYTPIELQTKEKCEHSMKGGHIHKAQRKIYQYLCALKLPRYERGGERERGARERCDGQKENKYDIYNIFFYSKMIHCIRSIYKKNSAF
jgi:hypothetical protein